MSWLTQRITAVIDRADAAGAGVDDGNVIDLLADNIPMPLADLREALAEIPTYRYRFPGACRGRGKSGS